MAISQLVTAEMGSIEEAHSRTTAQADVSTANPKTGTYAYRLATSANTAGVNFLQRAAGGAFRTVYQSMSCWLCIAALPTTNGTLVRFLSGGPAGVGVAQQRVLLNQNGRIQITDAATASVASADGVVPTGRYFRLDVDCGYNAGAGCRVFIDGVLVVSKDNASITLCDAVTIGFNVSDTITLDYDDLVFYDSSIPADMIGVAHSILTLRPTSDNARNGWTDGNGGTSSLFESPAAKSPSTTGSPRTATP